MEAAIKMIFKKSLFMKKVENEGSYQKIYKPTPCSLETFSSTIFISRNLQK